MAKFLGLGISKQETPTVVEMVSPSSTTTKVDPLIQDDKIPEGSFWCVEEPFVVNSAIPADLTKAKNGKQPNEIAPCKVAFHLFSSFEDASAYGQRLNKNLLIYEIRPSATVRPQIALVTRLDEAA
jgi:hypothetical protein